jgi:hypothetical protein
MHEKSDVRRVFMPYCLQRLEDGRYVVLNRYYKPLGLDNRHFDYDDYAVKLRITAKGAAKLSFKGSEDVNNIYLYNDGSIPTRGAAAMKAYLGRIATLMKLKVSGIPLDGLPRQGKTS